MFTHRLFVFVFILIGIAACQQPVSTPAEEESPSAGENASLTRTSSTEGASVYFISPADSARITGDEMLVQFGLRGMGVAPAGVDFPDTGHHHLLIDIEELSNFDLPIPSDSNHVHFGKGQTETTLQLPPGVYTLQLVLGDRYHIPHDPPLMSKKITIFVE